MNVEAELDNIESANPTATMAIARIARAGRSAPRSLDDAPRGCTKVSRLHDSFDVNVVVERIGTRL